MWVVFNLDTGESTEDMRFATKGEAAQFIQQNHDPDFGRRFGVRYES